MRILKLFFLLVAVVTLTTRCKCDKDPKPKTVTEILTGNAWKVKSGGAFMNGAVAPGNFDAFRISFTATGYTVTQGGAPVKPTKANNGTWVFENNNANITFDKATANERVTGVTTITAEGFSISWTDEADKLKPTYKFDLVPAQ